MLQALLAYWFVLSITWGHNLFDLIKWTLYIILQKVTLVRYIEWILSTCNILLASVAAGVGALQPCWQIWRRGTHCRVFGSIDKNTRLKPFLDIVSSLPRSFVYQMHFLALCQSVIANAKVDSIFKPQVLGSLITFYLTPIPWTYFVTNTLLHFSSVSHRMLLLRLVML